MRATHTLWILIAGCTTDAVDGALAFDGDWEGIEEVAEGLRNLSSRCAALSQGILTCTLTSSDKALFAKAPDNTITINGVAAGGATATTMKQLVIASSGGSVTVILDYQGGTFGLGSATQPGTTISLVGGGDALKIHGSTQVDNYVAGVSGISINGDAFNDIVVSGAESLVVSLDAGNDSFHARGNAATGNAMYSLSNITVFGGAGNDRLGGGQFNDTLNGGDGDDVFETGNGLIADGADTYNGNAGSNDCVDYSTRTSANGLAPFPVVTVTANDAIGNDGTAETDNVQLDIECIKGGPGNDVLGGNPSANTIFGNGGNDTLNGFDGNDTLYGGDGDDTLQDQGTDSSASGADVFSGGAGIDTMDYTSRTTAISVSLDALANDGQANEGDLVMADVENVNSGSGDDTLTGSPSANRLEGRLGNDVISGGAGDDTLLGGGGDDTLFGNDGNDVFDEQFDSNGSDVISGGNGIDTVNYAARAGAGEAIQATMDGLAADDGQQSPLEGDNIKADIENLFGSSVAAVGDIIVGNASANQLEGNNGNDVITGAGGDDVINGGAGNDVIDCDDPSGVGAGSGDINIPDGADTTPPVRCEL